MKKKKGTKKLHMKKSSASSAGSRKLVLPRFVLNFLPIILILAGGGYVYAKYYSVSAQRGIAIATGIYFSSNYAVEVKTDAEGNEDGSSTESGDTTETQDEYVESLVNSSYMGGDYEFDFEVRNYENNLLFNASGVEIPYKVRFWLGSEPVGAAYTVGIDGDSAEASTLVAGEENAVTFLDQQISGGAAKSNKYEISIIVADTSVTHTVVPIYACVETLDGSIITRTLKGKMVMNNVDRPESFIESQKFIVPNETEGMDQTLKFEKLSRLSMLTYEVRTVGDVLADDVTEELKLSWDPTVLQIDLFDDVYREWLKNNPNASGPLDDGEITGWKYITIKVMPYSAENIGFFRGSAYDTKVTDVVETGVDGMETLHKYIKAQKYTAE